MSKFSSRPIAITPGEPAGIGPDIVIDLVNKFPDLPITLIGDPELFQQRAKQLGRNFSDKIAFEPIKLQTSVRAQQLDVANVDYVLRCLNVASDGCLSGKYRALVTGPVHKGIINDAGIAFAGHTQYLAERAGTETLMLFVLDQMKVALATTHIPLKEVPAAITEKLLKKTLAILADGLKKYFALNNPTILVAGLNPHAGEDGHLGREEIEVISPALNQLRREGFNLVGPLSADTIFTGKNNVGDAILAMYHDQALPVIKSLGFGEAVNVTLGLPYLRTSVDHGTALDLAGTGKADSASLIKALQLAYQLTENSHE